MEPGGGTSGAKWVDVNTDSSELSASTASNTTLPHLEATDAERALDDKERRRRRKEARKLKREAREKEKEEQWLEDKKQRKEERRLKREARRKRREARKKKEEEKAKRHHQAYQVVPKMEMMMSHTKCRRGTRRRKERARPTTTNMLTYPLTILLFL